MNVSVEPDLTVVLCTFNGAAHIEEQIDSILGQSVLPGTVVLSDDGSDDDTVARVEARFTAGRGDAPVLLRLPATGERLGAGKNFARAIAATRTEYIALSDQDDIWHRDRLARTLRALRDRESLWLVASNTEFIDERGRHLPGDSFRQFGVPVAARVTGDEQELLAALMRRNFVQGMTFTFRRALVDVAGEVSEHFLHDYWFALQAAARGRMTVVDDPLVSYRLHRRNVLGVGERRPVLRLVKRVHWFLVRPRRGRSRRLVEWSEIEKRVLSAPDLPIELRGMLEEKVDFERRRARGSGPKAAQVFQVLSLVLAGAYGRLDRDGARAALDDLLWRRSA